NFAVRMSGIERALVVALVSGAAFVWLTPSIRDRLRQRSIFAFYAAATMIVMILSAGPTIRQGSDVLLESAPYGWLMAIVPGMDGRDPSVLLALASFSPLDVIVDESQDRDGSLDRYAASIPGIVRLGEDGPRVRYALPETAAPVLGVPIPVAGTESTAEWVVADLGASQPVTAVELSYGAIRSGFPQRMTVQVSDDAESWTTA